MTPRAIRSLGVLSFILGTATAAVWQPHGVHADSTPCNAPTDTPPTTDVPPVVPSPTAYAEPRFNEVFPDPEGTDIEHEFIELRNAGTAGTLDGWVLETAAGKTHALAGTLSADGYVALQYATTKISLLNAGMTLTLRDAQGTVRDTLTYGASKVGKTYARKGDGAWEWTASATPGAMNVFAAPEVVPPPTEPAADPEPAVTEPSPATSTIDPATVITLSEFIPDPDGSDDGEWIELRNTAAVEVPLDGLLLDDIEGGSAPFALHGFTIAANAWLVIPKASSKINLNNDADSVRLLTAAGVVIQQAAYVNAPVGKARALVGDAWMWAVPTPGAENASASAPGAGAVTGTVTAGTPPEDGTPTEETTVLDVGSLDEASDELLQVEAVVTLPPGRIGTRTFAVSDGAGLHGAIVRAYGSQAMPKLAPGDIVRISGRATASNDAMQLSTTGSGITRLSGGELPASARGVGDISAADTGIAVTVRGLVARRTSATLVLTDPDTGSEVPIRLAAPIDAAIAKGTTVDARGVVRVRSGDVEVMAIDKQSVSQVLLPSEPAAAVTPAQASPQLAEKPDGRTFGAALPGKSATLVPILVIAGSGAAIVAAVLRRKRPESGDEQLLDAMETTR